MERYYRIEFTAKLQQMMLAFKMECDIEIFWKRGQKVAQTGKTSFKNCTARFDQELTISCNMVFDTQNKIFKEKLTKFAIVIYTQKGNKQAGQIIFDVAPFLNERNKTKNYQLALSKCPDKNAKLAFSLKAKIIEEKSLDTLSESSLVSVDIQNLAGKTTEMSTLRQSTDSVINTVPLEKNKSSTSIMIKNKQKSAQMVPTTDRMNQRNKTDISNNSNTERNENITEVIKQYEIENKKIQQQLKRKQQLKKQNQQLKKRLKDDDYESCKDYKKKIQQGRKQIQNLIQQSKGSKKVNEDIKKIQNEILKCKQQIMRIFNQSQKFGHQATDKIQLACGIKQY